MAEDTTLESVENFLQCFYYVFLPLVLLSGILCFVKSVIRSTKFYGGTERLDGKTIVITGGSNGLGRALAVELCRRGARVISACRTRLRRDSTSVFLREKSGSFNHRVMYMDLNNLESVRNFAQELCESEQRIDCLINNAGVICDRDFTADGIDRMMGINYVGHFLLTNLLADKIISTPDSLGRVINITGGSFTAGALDDLRDLENKKKNSYELRTVYRSSKLALYLMSRELARRYSQFDICSLCVDPGLLNTDFYGNLPPPQNTFWSFVAKCMFRTPEEGMQSVLFALLQPDLKNSTGMVVKDCEVFTPANCNWTDSVIEDIWNSTTELIRSKGVDLEIAAVGEEEDLGSLQLHDVEIDLARLSKLAKRSLTDDEDEEGPQILPRPATPPRSNKLVYDEGDEVVDFVEFKAEEPPAVVRTTPSRQGSLESKDKSPNTPQRGNQVEEDDDGPVSREQSTSPTVSVEPMETHEEHISEADKDIHSPVDVRQGEFEARYEAVDIVEDLAGDIEKIQEMLQEEESADLQRIEEMLREDGTSVDEIPPSDEDESVGTDIRRVGAVLQEGATSPRQTLTPDEALDPDHVFSGRASGEVLQENRDASSSRSLSRPNLSSNPEGSYSPTVEDSVRPFDFNHEQRNNQMHNSLEDVKMRRLLLYPSKKRISLS